MITIIVFNTATVRILMLLVAVILCPPQRVILLSASYAFCDNFF